MSKLFIRLTVVAVSLYMILCTVVAATIGVSVWSHAYTVLFEICVCLCMTAQGKYHCRFMRWTAYGICASDTLMSADELFDFMPRSAAIMVPVALIAVGLSTTTALAIRHYHKVRKIKRQWNKTPQNTNLPYYRNYEESSPKEYGESTNPTTAQKRKPTAYSLGSTPKAEASSTDTRPSTTTML